MTTYDYHPYGTQALGGKPDGPGYTGHLGDADTGLVYMQARYYTQAWFMREVQAYDYELSSHNIRRFGLTPEEIDGERAKKRQEFQIPDPGESCHGG